MKKSFLIAGALLVFGAASASAAGINLSWDDCGTSGAVNKTFACNTNTGLAGSMVGSFDPPTIPEFLGISAQVDIETDQANLPNWWKHGTGQCRGSTALSTNFDFTANSNCIDPYAGQAAGGFAYEVGFGSTNRARFRIQCAIPIDQRHSVDAGTEYYGFRANLQRAKTVGVDGCAGCDVPACIVLNEIQLFQPPAAGSDPFIFNPITRNHITWQSSPVAPPGCPASTPTQSRTWGQVKSLYR